MQFAALPDSYEASERLSQIAGKRATKVLSKMSSVVSSRGLIHGDKQLPIFKENQAS